MSSSEIYDTENIAVIGMSGRFPGANNIAEFWRNLRDGVESVSFFSREELKGLDPAVLNHPAFVNAGGVVDGIELFDASFFGYNPREAEVLDPQQRLFMECAWQALETAGYDAERFAGAIGVYAGASLSAYLFNILANREVLATVGSFQVLISNDKDHLTTHVSYKLNLKGPSVTVQTACSTSLVAVCLACQSLLDHQCDMALAGGVGLKVPQKTGYLYQEGMINSPDGHCRTFDAKAKGTVGGSGVGVVALRRLADAVADGDNILAIIKGFAINNDGSLKVGYTAPSVEGQAEVIAMAQAMAEVDPETITYVEAHGTATPLGDPIEVAALTKAFRAGTDKKNFCAIGSVKSNIGHLDPAAGVAGLIKTILMLKHKLVPASLHFERPNPEIDFASSPFYVSTELSEWKQGPTPRRAGVSSFGIGGTNAHVILEEAPASEGSGPSRPAQLLLLSARTSTALETATSNLKEYLRQNPDVNFADLVYTCQVGRRAFDHRGMVVCENSSDAISVLSTSDPTRLLTAQRTTNRPVVFMFPGQGAQYVNMALELYKAEPTFRTQVDLCSELLQPLLDQDLRKLLYPEPAAAVQAEQQLERTSFTQPALFVIEYALAQLWMEWGVKPYAMIGHSIGEYVAACLAGVMSLEDALRVVATRGRMMQQLPPGSMLAIPLAEKDVRPLLNGNLDLAAINGQSLCVVSGSPAAVGQLEAQLKEQGQNSQRLHTSHAFHSRMMDPILQPFTQLLSSVILRPPRIPFISNLSGDWVTAEEATDPNYWARHLRQTVRFAGGLEQLLKGPESILLEIGPGETLSTLVRQHRHRQSAQVVISSLRRPHSQQSDVAGLLTALGRLWLNGVEVDWSGFYAPERRRRLSLPTYPFERQRYWIEARPSADSAQSQPVPPVHKRDIAEWLYTPSWIEMEPLQIAPGTSHPEAPPRWLVFRDGGGLGGRLTERLRSRGMEVVEVLAGEQFAQPGEYEYAIDPRQPGHYGNLIQSLRARDKLPQKIAHLWNFNSKSSGEQFQSFDEAQEMGFLSVLSLVQALTSQNIFEPVRLAVISSGVHRVTGEEPIFPERATVLAACKVIPQECPNIRCQHFDIVLSDRDTEGFTDQLIGELTSAEINTVVAYRMGKRWTQVYEKVGQDSSSNRMGRLRQRGVYLITGGLGNIGLAIAEELAKAVQARLVLVGRSAFPAKETWMEWLSAHGDHDAVNRKINILQTIEKLGSEVLIVAADVADEDQMRQVVEQARARFGGINGVIHGAGTTTADAFCPVYQADRKMAERHFQPKARGLAVLEAVLREAEVDFWVLLSSLSTVLGGLGFVAYSAANIFMDVFASKQNQQHDVPWITINWDGWEFREQLRPNTASTIAESAMLPSEGVEAFRRILSIDSLRHVVVSVGDLHERIAQWIDLESLRGLAQSSSGSTQLHARPPLAVQYVPPRNKIEQVIANAWQDLLGIEHVGVYDNFFELGGHSLIAIQIISRLRDAFQIELSVNTLFDASTVADLAATIEKNSHAKQAEVDKITEMLGFVEQLSESEIQQLLTATDQPT